MLLLRAIVLIILHSTDLKWHFCTIRDRDRCGSTKINETLLVYPTGSPLLFVPNQGSFYTHLELAACCGCLKCSVSSALQTKPLKRYVHLTNIIFGICWHRDSLEQTSHLGRENMRDCVQCTVYRSPFFSIYPIKLTGNECSSVAKGRAWGLFSSHQTFIRPLILLLVTTLAYRKGQKTALQIQIGIPRAKSASP